MAPENQSIAYTIGVTGHRDVCEEARPALLASLRRLLKAVRSKIPHTPIIILTGLAEGADRLVLEAITEVENCSYIALLPKPKADYLNDFPTQESRDSFAQLCEAAVKEVCVYGFLRSDTGSEKEAPSQCYRDLGAYLALNSDLLLAFWDGTFNHKPGGTGDVIDMRINGLAPEYVEQNLSLQLETGRAVQIWTPRISKSYSAAEMRTPGKMTFLETDNKKQPFKASKLGQVLGDRIINRDLVNAQLQPLSNANNTGASKEGAQNKIETVDLQGIVDKLAGMNQARIQRAWIVSTVAGAGSLGLLQAYIFNPGDLHWLIAHLCVLTFVIIWLVVSKSYGWEARYVDFRSLGEALRVKSYLTSAGVKSSMSFQLPWLRMEELGWLRGVLRSSEVTDDTGDIVVEVHETVTAGKSWFLDQLEYFNRKPSKGKKRGALVRAERNNKIVSKTIFLFMLLGVTLGMMELFGKLFQLTDSLNLGSSLSIAAITMFSLSGVLAALSKWAAYEEKSIRYQKMVRLYEAGLKLLDRAEEQNSKELSQKVIVQVAQQNLEEISQWVMTHQKAKVQFSFAGLSRLFMRLG